MSQINTLLAEIEARAKAATYGPWKYEDDGFITGRGGIIVAHAPYGTDGVMISSSRTDIPRLVAALSVALKPLQDADDDRTLNAVEAALNG